MIHPEDDLVEAVVLAARAMNALSAPCLLPVKESLQVMITTQEEYGGHISWWIRLITAEKEPIRSWHAEGQFGLMNAATQLSLHVYPYKRGRL
jgi:hypothetical protein